jgi:hypothetical protein
MPETTIFSSRRVFFAHKHPAFWALSGSIASILLLFALEAGAAPLPDRDAKFEGSLRRILALYESKGEDAALQRATVAGVRLRTVGTVRKIPLVITPQAGVQARAMSSAWFEAHGIAVEARSKSWIRVAAPLGLVRTIAQDSEVAAIALPLRPIPFDCSYGMGSYISQAVAKTCADSFQAHNFTGAGVKVAVVDMGFIGIDSAMAHGDLPAGTIKIDLPGSQDNPITTVTDHGTAVAENIMDIAPGATLYCIMVTDQVDMENARDTIRTHAIRIANHSVGWYGASYYNDSGPISRIVDSSHDQDSVFWAVAAGNAAESHWRGPWLNPSGNDVLDYSAADSTLTVTDADDSEIVSLCLNWNEYSSTHGPATDLNLYLYNKSGVLVDSSTNVQSATKGTPVEELSFIYCTAAGPYSVKVKKASGTTTNLNITLFADPGTATLTLPSTGAFAGPGSSIAEPADAHGSFTAGAVNQAYYDSSSPPIEYFSSRGPTTDGREKPDIAGADGTECYTYGTTDAFGTSFSTPTVAGAAALLLQRYAPLSVVKLADTLRAWAKNAPAGGWDSAFGAGLLNLKYPSAPPVLAAPSNNSCGVALPAGLALSWSTVPGAASYTLQVATAASFSTTVANLSSLTGSSTTLAVALAANTSYYWRCEGVFTSCCNGPWAGVWSFSTGIHRTIPVAAGWNMKSLDIHPTDSTTAAVFSVRHGFLLVNDGKGNTYCPSLGIDQIGHLATGSGYQVYADSADTIDLTGSAVAVASTPITLPPSVWTIAAYLPQANMPVATALAGIAAKLILATDNAGDIYWPSYGINSIDTMRVGEGYYLVTSAAASLTYPSGAAKSVAGGEAAPVLPAPQHFTGIRPTGSRAILLARHVGFPGRVLSDNGEAGAFDSRGRLVGSGMVRGGTTAFAVWGDDGRSAEKDGCAPAEKISFRLWDGRAEYPLATGGDGEVAYAPDAILTATLVTASPAKPARFDLPSASPNPFRGSVRIGFEVPSLQGAPDLPVVIGVYDIKGSLIERIVNSRFAPGSYSVSWGGKPGAPGGSNVYIVRMQAINFEKRVKLVEIR